MSRHRLLYTLVFYLLLPLLLLHLLWRGRKNPAYWQRWPERLGFVAGPVKRDQALICLHAVSVGETMAARPLVEQLLRQFPAHQLWLTSTTPTGSDTVQRLFGTRVLHSYLPYDTPAAVKRFLQRVQPDVLLIMETEIWPNLFAACARQQTPLLLLNARLSERSVRRYQKFPVLVNQTLAQVKYIMARTQQDAEYFRILGAQQGTVRVSGDIKFDVFVPDGIREQGQRLRTTWGQRRVWCAGSTHAGEDELILQAQAQLTAVFPDLLLILVPRHPERFAAVAELCRQQGFNVAQRSAAQPVQAETSVLLGDSMGELLLWYAASDVALIGGSLVPAGGHNPLEALGFAIPVLSGQHVHNFADLYPVLVAQGAAERVDSVADLVNHLQHWLTDEAARQQAGQAGQQLLVQNRGVTAGLVHVIRDCLQTA